MSCVRLGRAARSHGLRHFVSRTAPAPARVDPPSSVVSPRFFALSLGAIERGRHRGSRDGLCSPLAGRPRSASVRISARLALSRFLGREIIQRSTRILRTDMRRVRRCSHVRLKQMVLDTSARTGCGVSSRPSLRHGRSQRPACTLPSGRPPHRGCMTVCGTVVYGGAARLRAGAASTSSPHWRFSQKGYTQVRAKQCAFNIGGAAVLADSGRSVLMLLGAAGRWHMCGRPRCPWSAVVGRAVSLAVR